MGYTDVPPPSAPAWLIPASTACLAAGIIGWLVSYGLMVRRSLRSKATPIPLIPLGLNLSWEVIWAFYVSDNVLERAGFAAWLMCDIPVLYVTLQYAQNSFASQPLVGRNATTILALVFLLGLFANFLFANWWFSEPNRGYGLKWGKTWRGMEARDATELSFWTAGFAQAVFSLGSLAMLLQRGHSGGASHTIWFFRFVGSQMGLSASTLILWLYWPEAHGFVWEPLSFILIGTTLICDIAYPFALTYVKAKDRTLPDGTVVSALAVVAPFGEKEKQ